MRKQAPHQCGCENCQTSLPHPDQLLHQHFNLLLSRLNEQQRRWWAAHEANRIGYGGIRQVALISGSGLDEKTITKGQVELADSLEGRPTDGIRLKGGGPKLAQAQVQVEAKKKTQPKQPS